MELAHKLRIFAPQFEVETLEVEEHPGTDIVRGTGNLRGSYAPEPVAVEDFANCLLDINSVKRFTKRYGPLWGEDQAHPGSFAFMLSQWIADRRNYRMMWDRLLGLEIAEDNLPVLPKDLLWLRDAQDPWKKVQTSGTFEITKLGLAYVADTLYSALLLKMLAVSVDGKLRRCAKPGCDQQIYFIAQHGKSRYCSEICAKWAQSEWKKEWWADKGQGYQRPKAAATGSTRLSPVAKKRGTKSGTQKAR